MMDRTWSFPHRISALRVALCVVFRTIQCAYTVVLGGANNTTADFDYAMLNKNISKILLPILSIQDSTVYTSLQYTSTQANVDADRRCAIPAIEQCYCLIGKLC